ncbi:MAG: SOS response-associated peptidase [Sneathiella sp.]
MCGRYTLTSPLDILRALFNFTSVVPDCSSYNIPPGAHILMVRRSDIPNGTRTASLARWGLVPSWSADDTLSTPLINARVETVTDKPSFKTAFRRQRCLIPANGFYEWKKISKDEKQPFYLSSKEHPVFAFAGLWDRWQSPSGNWLESCVILTMPAAESLAPIHHRMPVTVPADQYDTWLSGQDRSSLPPSDRQVTFDAYSVHKKVGNVENDTADLLQEVKFIDSPRQQSLF